MVRSGAQDDEAAVVTVEELAFGLHASQLAPWESAQDAWAVLSRGDRAALLAQARFVLGVAEEVPEEFLSRVRGELRWGAGG